MRQELLDYIYSKNERQRKKLSAWLTRDEAVTDLDSFLGTYSAFLEKEGLSLRDLGDSYLQLIDDMFASRLDFMRNGGKYVPQSQSEAAQRVYDRPEIMTKYMLGLALSQFLWAQHHALFSFFRKKLAELSPNPDDRFMEIGSGHGLFLLELLKAIHPKSKVDVVDISETSLSLSKKIVKALLPGQVDRVTFVHSDIAQYDPPSGYRFITLGEVLEHVENPGAILTALRSKLAANGVAFISTCANSPAPDHIYQFHTVQEIRDLLVASGFEIVDELVAPSENLPWEKLIKDKIDVLYGAIIRRSA